MRKETKEMSRQIIRHRPSVPGAGKLRHIIWQNLLFYLANHILTGVQVAQLQLPEGKVRSSRVMLSNVFRQEDLSWRMVLCHSFEIVQDL